MRKNIKTLFKNSTKERFSLRKLNIGVCSVVLGLTFVGVTTQKAYADTIAGVQEAKQVKSQSSIISSVCSRNKQVELDQKKQEPDEKVFDDTDKLIRKVSSKEKQDVNQEKHVSEDNTKTKNTSIEADDPQSINKVANNENKYEVTPKAKGLNNQSINSKNIDKDKTTGDITLKNISSNKQKIRNITSTLYKRAIYSTLFEKNAWHKDEDGNWTYSKSDGKQANEEWVVTPDGQRYYFDDDGNMAHDGWVDTWDKHNWSTYYFDHNGHYEVNAWHKDEDDNWTYSKSDGKQANEEWVVAPSGKWYYFDDDGNMAHNGWVDTRLHNGDYSAYYFDNDGQYEVNAWHQDNDGNWTYSKSDGKQANEEWVVAPSGKWYYFDDDGNMVHDGWYETNYKDDWSTYYFDHNGHYEVNTWHKDENDNWTYSKSDGKQANEEWLKVTDGKWYYFDDDGNMAHNGWVDTRLHNGDYSAYYFDNDGQYEVNAWHQDNDGNWTYSKSDGKQANEEWVVAPSGQWYYFDENGNMAHDGWFNTNYKDEWSTYYFDHDGHYVKNAWHQDNDGNLSYSKSDGKQAQGEWLVAPNGKWYYFDGDGNMAHDGWYETEYKDDWVTYYFDHDGHYVKNAWHQDNDGNWTYSKSDGKQAQEEWVIAPSGQWYYFDDDGSMVHDNWIKTHLHDGSWSVYYFDHDGHYARNTWRKENDNWIYFKSNGKPAQEEWVKAADGKWYYFDYNGHMVHDVVEKDITTIEGDSENNYYFDHNGHYITNAWHDEDGNRIYFKSDGKQAIDEWIVAPDGQWYYFDVHGNMAHDGWLNNYYFDHNGHYVRNAWHNENGNWSYFKSDGQLAQKEWVKATDGNWYYFDDSDHMVHDCVKEGIATLNGSGKNNYYFDHNGHYEVNTWYKNKDNNWNYFKLDGQQAYEEWVKALDGNWYYFDYDGNMAHDGWLGTNCKNRWLTYYFDHNGHYAENAWHNDGYGNWSYSKVDGTQAKEEWLVVDSQWYYFDDNGNMARDGWVNTLLHNGSKSKYYFDENGHYTKNAWHKDKDGNWSYSKSDGTRANQEWVVAPSGNWYYFDNNGNMAHGGWVNTLLHNGSKSKYYFDENGHYLKNAWHDDYNGRTYFKSDGKQAHNEWVLAQDGEWYYFDDTKHMVHSGWVDTLLHDGSKSKYYFDENGHMVHDVIEKRIPTPDGSGVNTYYFDHNGNYIKNAWHDDDNEKTYFKSDGKQAIYEWVKATDGQWYYFDENGHMAHDGMKEDIPKIGGGVVNTYYFDHNGHYEVNTWHNDGNEKVYFKSDGSRALSEWVKAVDGQWYYFDKNGHMAHDGRYDTNYNGKWVKYYFDHDGHYEVNTWHNDGNEKVYFKSDGSQAFSEWVKASDGQWYYFDTYGNMDQPRGEWAKVSDGRWYYFDRNGNMAHDGVKKDIATVNGSDGVNIYNTYYFDHNGHYETNTWHNDGSEKIYFKSDGTQAKDGWAKASDGQWYYFDKYGHMAHDVMKKDIVPLSGSGFTTYYFDHDGHYEVNTWHNDGSEKIYFKSDGTQAKDGWVKASDGKWYYFDENGHMAHDVMKKDIPTIGGGVVNSGVVNTYYFDHNGHYEVNTWHKEGNEKIYFKSDGTQAHEEWVSIPGGKNPYYFDYTGYMAHSGWLFTKLTNGVYANYYFDDNGQYEEDSWHEEGDNYRSYLKANGKRANEEWVIIGGQWYYFDYNGFMVHDCYLGIPLPDSDSNVPATIPAYYFDHNGHPIKLGNLPDISKEDGYMVEELSDPWRHKGNHLIYKKSDLTQAVDEWINAGDGNRYYFDNNGYCTKREKINA